MKLLYYILFAILSVTNAFAFDPQFSMFYSVPLYINPAFAGSRHANRAIFHQRWQWPNQAARYTTSFFGFDTFSEKYRSGFGVSAVADNQMGTGLLGTGGSISDVHLKASYAYELYVNRAITMRFGLEGGFIQRNINALSTISDVTPDGITGKSFQGGQILIPTIGAGTVLYTGNLYAGLTVNHINQPNVAYASNEKALLPMKITLVGGYKIPLALSGSSYNKNGRKGAKDLMYLTPTFTYKHQNGNEQSLTALGQGADQIDLGLYLTRKWFIAGVWYRGIPFKGIKAGSTTLRNNESIVFLLGAGYNGFGFGYAFDLTVSSQRLVNTYGAHELNLTYTFKTKRRKGPARVLPCPDFEEDILQRAGAGSGK